MISLLANVDVPDLEAAIDSYRCGVGLRLRRRLFEGTVAEMLGASSPIYLSVKPAGPASSVVPVSRDYRRIGRQCILISWSRKWKLRCARREPREQPLRERFKPIRGDVWVR